MNDQNFASKFQSKPAISVHEILLHAGLIRKSSHGELVEGFSLADEIERRIGHGSVGNEQAYKDVANAFYSN